MTRNAAFIRLAAYYALLFTAVGIQLPFWPVWLSAQGLSAAEIGMLAAVGYLCRIVVNPVVGIVVDRRGDRRKPMIALALAAATAWAFFGGVDGFAAILVVTLVASGLWAAIMPVGDSLALMMAAEWKLDYGRVRLWGSAAFIAAAVLTGRLLLTVSPSVLVWLVTAALVATALGCAPLPDLRAPSHHGARVALRPLLTSAPFLLFLACTALNQASHTVYYAFATLHWRAAGIGDDTIGLLWSEGVVAEIVLFAVSAPLVRRLGAGGLLMAAGAGGVLRWLALGLTTSVPLLAMAQILHAATFGCAHLGAMRFMHRAIPPGLGVRAQGLYAAVAMGVAPGLMSPLTGALFQRFGGGAFLAMAVLSLGALVAGWGLRRRWSGGVA